MTGATRRKSWWLDYVIGVRQNPDSKDIFEICARWRPERAFLYLNGFLVDCSALRARAFSEITKTFNRGLESFYLLDGQSSLEILNVV